MDQWPYFNNQGNNIKNKHSVRYLARIEAM